MYMKKPLSLGFVGLLVLSVAMVMVPVRAEHPAQAIWVEPAFISLLEGEVFSVDVMINITSPTLPGGGTGLFGFEYKLFWNSTVINLTSYTTHVPAGWEPPAGFLCRDEVGVWVGGPKDGLDYHWYCYTALYGAPPFTGVMSLSTYNFQVVSLGSSVLDIQEDKLVDDTATEIDHTTEDGYFSDPYPRALFTYSPELPLVDETVTFNASASYDPDGYIIGYVWDFGDLTIGIGMIVTHAYTAAGTYNVTLTVTDNDGRTGTTRHTVKVATPPVASFTYSPVTPLVNQTVTFDASASYDPDGWIVNYTWNFGDGSPIVVTNETIITHAYTAAGTYNVTLTVTDNDGLTDSASADVTVEEAPPPPVVIYTDKYTYSAGETMYLGLDIANPYDFPITVCVAIWLERPVGSIILILHAHAVTLPAGFTYSDPSFESFVLPSIPPGIYTWHAAFLNPTTHAIIVEDTAEWEFV